MNYRDFSKLDLSKLDGVNKITLVKHTEFGYPVVHNLTLNHELTKLEDYAQYKDTFYIVGKPFGKRKLRAYRIKPYEEFYIFKGTITEEKFISHKKEIHKDEDITVTTFGMCYDKLKTFISGAKEKPILSTEEI